MYYLVTVFQANLALATDILTPEFKMSTAIVDVPLKSRKERHILAMSNLISMTPGSLTLNYNPEENSLKVHIMYKGKIENFQKSTNDLQEMIMKIF
jgi:multicomponent Na+:H+ antiporter subunit E